jgi:hypothetical protein
VVRSRAVAQFVAVCRLAIGAGFVAAPQLAMRPWIGGLVEAPEARLLARVVGARDLLLALGVLTASDRREGARWLVAGVAADAADLALTVGYRRRLPRRGVALVCAIAAGGLVLGAGALSDSRRRPPGS